MTVMISSIDERLLSLLSCNSPFFVHSTPSPLLYYTRWAFGLSPSLWTHLWLRTGCFIEGASRRSRLSVYLSITIAMYLVFPVSKSNTSTCICHYMGTDGRESGTATLGRLTSAFKALGLSESDLAPGVILQILPSSL